MRRWLPPIAGLGPLAMAANPLRAHAGYDAPLGSNLVGGVESDAGREER